MENNNDKLFGLMEKMYGEMQEGFKGVNQRLDNVESEINKTNLIIENEVKTRIESLFDNQKNSTEQLNRIEKEVSKHEEFILERIK